MAKLEFNKDPKRKINAINETKISEPQKTFSIEKMQLEHSDNSAPEISTISITDSTQKKMGRPKKNKEYSTIRIQRHNTDRVNSLQNTLDYETQDDLISAALDRLENSLDSDQKIMFKMYMKTYEGKRNRKK